MRLRLHRSIIIASMLFLVPAPARLADAASSCTGPVVIGEGSSVAVTSVPNK
jgi:hypothetical protein